MVMEGDLNLGDEHTIQYTDDVLWNCTSETYIILLTNVTSINSTKFFSKSNQHEKCHGSICSVALNLVYQTFLLT